MQKLKTKYIPIFVALILMTALPLHSRKLVLKVDERAIAAQSKLQKEVLIDSTICLKGEEAAATVRLFGYDKPHDAGKESVFVSNLLENDTIESVSFEVDYMSVGGEALHSRTVSNECRILPGQTMRLLFPSWDATHTFYYYRTPPKRKQGLTPYKVSVIVNKVGLSRRSACKIAR